jgi:ATP-dependent Lhr-like helicase
VTGLAGEALINHYEFDTAFSTPEEYRVVADGKQLGTIPLEGAVLPGMFIIFAGRRWEVLSVDAKSRLILVRHAGGGSPPKFGGSVGFIDAAIRKEMLRLYTSTEVATFLDSQAREFLDEGRQHFKLYKLNESSTVEDNGNMLIFPWEGDKVVNTLAVELFQSGLKPHVCFGVINVNDMSSDSLISHLQGLVAVGSRDPVELASLVPNKLKEKHDRLLSESLLTDEYAAKWLDTQGAWAFLQSHFT